MSHKVTSSRLATDSHSSLEFDLLEQPDPGALLQVNANLRGPRTTTEGINLAAGFRPSLLEAHGTEGAASGSHGRASRERAGWMATRCRCCRGWTSCPTRSWTLLKRKRSRTCSRNTGR